VDLAVLTRALIDNTGASKLKTLLKNPIRLATVTHAGIAGPSVAEIWQEMLVEDDQELVPQMAPMAPVATVAL